MRTYSIVAFALALGAASSAFAATDMECTEASMTKMKTDAMAMSDGEKKTMAVDQMKMAEDMMMKKDMDGCMKHMKKAMKAMK